MKTLFVTLAFIFANTMANAQPTEWAKSMGNPTYDQGSCIAVDGWGDVYTTGYFQSTVDFDPGPSTFNLISNGGNDIFISKLDPLGNYIWAVGFGGTGSDIGQAITLDAAGNMYITGKYNGTIDFDPGAGTFNMTSANDDIFILKLDASGNFVWAKSMGAPGLDQGLSIKVDASGNVYTTGSFQGIVDFDPGAPVYNLYSAGLRDIFVLKLNAAGNFIWTKQMGGTGYDYGENLMLDGSGNIFVTGYFENTVDFDPGAGTANLTSAGAEDIFISKFDNSGNYIWARTMGGSGTDMGYGLATDGSGNIYATGLFNNTADFNPGAGVYNLSSVGGDDIFILALNASGNFIWARGMGSSGIDQGLSLKIDPSGFLYTTGSFSNTVDFDPGPGTTNLSSLGRGDVFISILDVAGNYINSKSMGGPGNDFGYSIEADAIGNIYTTGYFQDTSDFDPGPAIDNLISKGVADIFVSKISTSILLPAQIKNFEAHQTQEAISLSWSATSEPNNAFFTIERSTNGKSFTAIATRDGTGNSDGIVQYQCKDDFPFGGNNYYRLKQTDKNGQYTYSNVIVINFKWSQQVMRVYPTINTGQFVVSVSSPSVKLHLAIFNSTGSFCYALDNLTNSNAISITQQARGIYFVRLSDEAGNVITKKIVKQ